MFVYWHRCLAVAVLSTALGGGAVAGPAPLSEAELDRVTAGATPDLDQLQQDMIERFVIPRLLRWQALFAAEPGASDAFAALQQLIDDFTAPSGDAPLPAVQVLAADDALTASRSGNASLVAPVSFAFVSRGRNVPGTIVMQSYQTDSAAGTSVAVEFSITGPDAAVIIPGGSAAAGS